MASVKISELPSGAAFNGDELLPFVQDAETRQSNFNAFVDWLKETLVESADVRSIEVLTQAEYDAISTKDPSRLYVILE